VYPHSIGRSLSIAARYLTVRRLCAGIALHEAGRVQIIVKICEVDASR